MPLPESILRAWTETDYRVRLSRGGYASIRCGLPVPEAIVAMLPRRNAPWGYFTAWNPAGVGLPLATNRVRQQRLRDELKADGLRYFCGAGVGVNGWREPSLFVPGISHARLDDMARHFGQIGVLRGVGANLPELHVLV